MCTGIRGRALTFQNENRFQRIVLTCSHIISSNNCICEGKLYANQKCVTTLFASAMQKTATYTSVCVLCGDVRREFKQLRQKHSKAKSIPIVAQLQQFNILNSKFIWSKSIKQNNTNTRLIACIVSFERFRINKMNYSIYHLIESSR